MILKLQLTWVVLKLKLTWVFFWKNSSHNEIKICHLPGTLYSVTIHTVCACFTSCMRQLNWLFLCCTFSQTGICTWCLAMRWCWTPTTAVPAWHNRHLQFRLQPRSPWNYTDTKVLIPRHPLPRSAKNKVRSSLVLTWNINLLFGLRSYWSAKWDNAVANCLIRGLIPMWPVKLTGEATQN